MKKTLQVFVLLANTIMFAQAPDIEWQKALGGTGSDYAESVCQTTDGGYIVVGTSPSNNGDVSGNHGGGDIWAVKLNANGDIDWQKCLGGSSGEEGNAVRQTADGGYIIAGAAASSNGDVSGGNGSNDFWAVKLDADGDIEWQNSLGGSIFEWAEDVVQTTDGGYVLAGYTHSNNGDVVGSNGGVDGWVVKLDALGVLQWQKCVGGSSTDEFRSVRQTTDGGFILSGRTNSNNGNVSGNNGGYDFWVVKLDDAGEFEWQNALGGSGNDNGQYVIQSADGSYMAIGSTPSNNGDVSGNHGGNDVWMAKIDATGVLQWQKCLGGTGNDVGRSIEQTTDNGYIIAGNTTSNNGDVSGQNGASFSDIWVVKTDVSGAIQWQKCLGGTSTDDATSVQQTADGGFVLAGPTFSNDIDVTDNNGLYDFWVVKLESTLSIDDASTASFEIYPNPASKSITIDSQFLNAHVKIVDVNGKLINTFTLNDVQTVINTEAMANGFYIVQIQNNTSVLTKKLIIKH